MKTPIDKIKSLQCSPRSAWEREFLKSLRERVEKGHPLTTNQSTKLDSIWSEQSK